MATPIKGSRFLIRLVHAWQTNAKRTMVKGASAKISSLPAR
jgi:hypothetical protein